MKIKHYVIVNFMSWQPVGWDREVGDPLLEQQRLATLEKYLLPSLERQTSRDFTLILYIGKQLSTTARDYLRSIKTTFPVIVGESGAMAAELKTAWAENDCVITSKMADDDMPWEGAATEVRRIAEQGLSFVIHGYRRGIVYVEGKGIMNWRYPNDYGHLAIFMSLIRTTEAEPMSINDLGKHNEVRTNAERDYKKFGLKELPAGWWNSDDTTDPAWCYVRHTNAVFGDRDQARHKWRNLSQDLSPLKEHFGFEESWNMKKIN